MLWHPPPHRDGPVSGLVWWRVLSRVRGGGRVDTARYWPRQIPRRTRPIVNFYTKGHGVRSWKRAAAVWVSPNPKRRGSGVHNLLRAVNGPSQELTMWECKTPASGFDCGRKLSAQRVCAALRAPRARSWIAPASRPSDGLGRARSTALEEWPSGPWQRRLRRAYPRRWA